MNCTPAKPPFQHIVFDCDSTLSSIEGIDELARDHKAAVADLTQRAMAGELALEAVYGKRLDIVRPTWTALMELGAQYIATSVPGARETVRILHGLGKRVSILSGGLRPAVMRLARELGIAGEDVFAVEAYCTPEGRYDGFDAQSLLTRDDGKPRLLRQLGAGTHCALIGDGATDMRCSAVVGRFIAYAGVVARPAVLQASQYVVRERDLRATLPVLLDAAEFDALRAQPSLLALLPAPFLR